MKKISMETFAQITKPFKDAEKKIKESEVVDLIHKIRKERKNKR